MEIYLSIVTTALVITQIIRVTQNTIQLNRERKLIKAQLDSIDEITAEDFAVRREAYKLLLEWLKEQLGETDTTSHYCEGRGKH